MIHFAESTPAAPPSVVASIETPTGRGAHRRWWARLGTVGALTAVLLGLGAGVASAHVTVNPGEVTAGSYAKITFRVPNESATASTNSLQVTLPTDHPFPSVSVQPVPGWVAAPKTVTLPKPVIEGKFTLTEAVESVTWTAQDGNAVKPGEFQEFSLSVGPVPDVGSLILPAVQTYSDGTIVKWADVAPAGTDPHSLDHPAPVLTITKASASGDENAGAATPTTSGSGLLTVTTGSASDGTARILAAIALLIAAVAVLIAVLTWRRRPVADTAGTATAGAGSPDQGDHTPDATPPATSDANPAEAGR